MRIRKRVRRIQTVSCSSVNGVEWFFNVGDTDYGWSKLTLTLWLAGDEERQQWGPECPCLPFAVGYVVGFEAAEMIALATRIEKAE